jgi:hypothetical protein
VHKLIRCGEAHARRRALLARLMGIPSGLGLAQKLLRSLLAVLLGLPAGLGHAAAIKIAPTAARAPLGGGFFAAGGSTHKGGASAQLALPNLPAQNLSAPNNFAPAVDSLPQWAPAAHAIPAAVPAGLQLPVARPLQQASRPAAVLKASPVHPLDPALREPSATQAATAARSDRRRSIRGALTRGAAVMAQALQAAPGQAAHLAGQFFHGDKDVPAAVEGDFKEAPQPAEQPRLPRFLQTAEQENYDWLVEVYEAAQQSRTARKVLKQIEELTGNGHVPLVLEIVDYGDSNEAEFNFDWNIVRLGDHMMKWEPAAAVPTLIHELTHVLQEAKGLPTAALELELEAYLHSFKVAHELGLSFKRGHALLSYSRKFKHSYSAFVEQILENYEDSISLMNRDFNAVEKVLLKQVAAHEKTVAEWEYYLANRQRTLARMQQLGFKDWQIKNFRADEVEYARGMLVSWEANLNWLLADLKKMRTPSGRKAYAKYTRSVLQRARAFQRVYGDSRSGRAKPVRIPTIEEAENYILGNTPLKKAIPKGPVIDAKWLAEFKATLDTVTQSNAIQVPQSVDAPWMTAVLQALEKTATGRDVLAQAAEAAIKNGRPLLIDVKHTEHARLPTYDWDTGVISVSQWVYRLPPAESAALLAGTIAQASVADKALSHSLELEIDGYVTSLQAALEAGIKPKRPSPLYFVQRMLKRKALTPFIEWVRKRNPEAKPFSGLAGTQFLNGLNRLEDNTRTRIKKLRKYLRSRRATYEIMRRARLPTFALRQYRLDEIVDTESKLLDEAATLAWIERDRELLADPARLEAYRTYAGQVMDRAAALQDQLAPQRRARRSLTQPKK